MVVVPEAGQPHLYILHYMRTKKKKNTHFSYIITRSIFSELQISPNLLLTDAYFILLPTRPSIGSDP